MVKKKSLVWRDCSEEELGDYVSRWLKTVDLTNAVVFLEGIMGAGKSTFVREVLRVLSPDSQSQGSPTFPLVQTYQTKTGVPFYHIDLYRLKSEAELSDSGIESQIDEVGSIACIEWASLFPDAFSHWFDESVPKLKAFYLVRMEATVAGKRNYQIEAF
jgi:tRNA threonylcarbamoyl adenosine modification protein YjeE